MIVSSCCSNVNADFLFPFGLYGCIVGMHLAQPVADLEFSKGGFWFHKEFTSQLAVEDHLKKN